MIWYWIAGILFTIAIAILIINFIRERYYLRKRTSEAFGPALREEIEEEREQGLARRKRFEGAMEEAQAAARHTGKKRGPMA